METNSETKSKHRITITLIALEILFGMAIGRLFMVQFLYSDRFNVNSAESRISENFKFRERRGQVLDRNYRILATNQFTLDIAIDPSNLRVDIPTASEQLASLLPQSTDELITKITPHKNRKYLKLNKDLNYDRIEEFQQINQKTKGIITEVKSQRVYPKGELAAHVVGATNWEGKGVAGIELRHESKLAPRERDGHNNNSNTIVLTIDEYVQELTEKALGDGCRQWEADKGIAIVMHSASGEILAMANYPSYDANKFSNAPPEKIRHRNPAISFNYEPGSVFKFVTAAAIIEQIPGLLDLPINCENGTWEPVNGHPIKDVSPHGPLTLSEIVQKSSNIGIAKIATYLDQDEFTRLIHDFGFGMKTGINLPSEEKGLLYNLSNGDRHTETTIPFGQGISVTSIQLLSALNAVANDGILLRPHIIRQKIDGNGKVLANIGREEVARVMSPASTETLVDILIGVTDVGQNGTGKNAAIEGYEVAGKTGTAQKAYPNGGGYMPEVVVASFAGFLPARDPLITAIVVLDNPKSPEGAPSSAKTAAPIFKTIAQKTINYVNNSEILAYNKDRVSEERLNR